MCILSKEDFVGLGKERKAAAMLVDAAEPLLWSHCPVMDAGYEVNESETWRWE